MHIWPAITVPLALFAVLRIVWPKANTGAKLAAFGGTALALWLMLALVQLSAALAVAGWLADGIIGDIHALVML